MSRKELPPGLHVILGDSAAGTFNAAFGAERLLIDQDVLSCGPTPACASLEAWKAMRGEYWRSVVRDGVDEHVDSQLNLLDNLARLRESERVTIWAATSLSEQLFVAHVIHRAIDTDIDPAQIHIVQFETLPSRKANVLGMGALNEQQIRAHPEPVPLAADTLRHYRDAWTAMTSPDPTRIEHFADSHADAGPWLKRALQLMLRRFPDEQSGLPYWDFMLLAATREHGPKSARVIANTMTRQWDDADLTGDVYLFGRLLRLGSPALVRPLLEITGNGIDMRHTEVRLTSFGLEVLDGRTSNRAANPIDDWAAGVRLSSTRGDVWFNVAGRLVRR